MQAILDSWKSLPHENLFLFWQKELDLKNALRQQLGNREVQLENEAEFQFLRLGLAYTGHKDLFYRIVFANLHKPQIQSALLNGPAEICRDFLGCLPQLIVQEKPASRNLQCLINLYREEFHPYYLSIAATLNKLDCDYLLERTANKNLRQLLKIRQKGLLQQSKNDHYGLLESMDSYAANPGIYGDKIHIIQQAITSMEACAVHHYSSPWEASRIKTLLETADLLFATGLLGDCLALLLAVYQQNTRLQPDAWDRNSLNKALNKMVRKSLPVYALLDSPSRAAQQSLDIYQTFFPELNPDHYSLRYLRLYQILMDNRSGNPQHTLIELTQTYHSIDKQENDILLQVIQNPTDIKEEDLLTMIKNMPERMLASPHETYVIMELLRYLFHKGLISLSREMSNLLLNDYLQLFQWIPSPLFINTDIRLDLGLFADEKVKNEIDQILNIRNQYSLTELRKIYEHKPAFFTADHNHIEKQLLLGSFLGVF